MLVVVLLAPLVLWKTQHSRLALDAVVPGEALRTLAADDDQASGVTPPSLPVMVLGVMAAMVLAFGGARPAYGGEPAK